MRAILMTTSIGLLTVFAALPPTATALPEVPDLTQTCPESLINARREYSSDLGLAWHDLGWADPEDSTCVYDYAVGRFSYENGGTYYYYVTAVNQPAMCCR